MRRHRVVIVGVGAAGTAAATELRRIGFSGALTLVNGEAVAPYNRTTVNKSLLQPSVELEAVRTVVPTDDDTTLLTARAVRVETDRRVVVLDDGRFLDYDALLIATGSRPRTLPSRRTGEEASRSGGRVTSLRSHDDSERIRRVLAALDVPRPRPGRIAIAGASLLGAETADALHGLGHEVFLIDPAANPLQKLLGRTVGAWVEAQHEENLAGHFTTGVDSLDARESGVALGLSNGIELSVDLLVEAVGVTPDVEWLQDSLFDLSDGVRVDDRLRACNAQRVFAAGDLARIGPLPRVEHWGHALAQGAHAARSIGHELQLNDDPGPFVPSGSYSTWLYGKAINVLGTHLPDDQEVALAPVGRAVHVSAYTGDGKHLRAAVTLGSGKLANKLRPLVAARAALEDAAEVVAATLERSAART